MVLEILFVLISLILCDDDFEEYVELPNKCIAHVIPTQKIVIDIFSIPEGDYFDLEVEFNPWKFPHNDSIVYNILVAQVIENKYINSTLWNKLITAKYGATCYRKTRCGFGATFQKANNTNYLYLILPPPFEGYYTRYHRKIKLLVNNPLTEIDVAMIVIISLAVFSIIVFTVFYCIFWKDPNHICDCEKANIFSEKPQQTFGYPSYDAVNIQQAPITAHNNPQMILFRRENNQVLSPQQINPELNSQQKVNGHPKNELISFDQQPGSSSDFINVKE